MKNDSIKSILVPLDFSKTSLNALETAIAIAKQQNANITLLNVVDSSLMFAFNDIYYVSEKAIDRIVDVYAGMFNSLLKKLKDEHNLNCTSEIKIGLVPQSIITTASEKEVDLIVMGTHGSSGVRELFIGSTAQQVIKISSCPVLTVPPNKKWVDFKTILFPIRPIASGVEKYDFLRKIMRHDSMSIKVLILAPTYNGQEKKILRKLAKELKKKLLEDEIKISGSLKSGGNTPKVVLKMSKSIGADMIVITVKNESAFKQFFIGPFEQRIVNHATVPVLSIRPKVTKSDSRVIIQQIHDSFPSQIPEFA